MELLESFVKGLLKGSSVTAVALGVTHKYDSLVDEDTPMWLRLTVDCMCAVGTFYCGLKVVEAAEKYIDEND